MNLKNLIKRAALAAGAITLPWAGVALDFSTEHYNDLWDASQGTVVTGHSGVHSATQITDMFGTANNQTSEDRTAAVFQDGEQAGFTHFVEWQTAEAVTIRSFNLIARHDGAGSGNRRAFNEFRLYGYDPDQEQFVLLHTLSLSVPYGDGSLGNEFFQWTNLDNEFSGDRFRAEFDQAGDMLNDGPRIVELDGSPAARSATVPNGWWLHYFDVHWFLNPDVDDAADPDGDSVENLQEYLDGSVPVKIPSMAHLTDSWDVSRGSAITASSGFHTSTRGSNLFGDYTGPALEIGGAIFDNGGGDGTVHFVEWTTPNPVEIRALSLVASFEKSSGVPRRALSGFRVYVFDSDAGNFQLIYSQTGSPLKTYDFGTVGGNFTLEVDLPEVVIGSQFRAEFVQFGSIGPRVDELNGYPVSYNDEIDDAWQRQYFGEAFRSNPLAAAGADGDRDGATNLEEFQQGLNPNVRDTGLFADLRLAPVVSWPSEVGQSYRVLRASSITPSDFEPITEFMQADSTSSIYVDIEATDSTGFYRIEMQQAAP